MAKVYAFLRHGPRDGITLALSCGLGRKTERKTRRHIVDREGQRDLNAPRERTERSGELLLVPQQRAWRNTRRHIVDRHGQVKAAGLRGAGDLLLEERSGRAETQNVVAALRRGDEAVGRPAEADGAVPAAATRHADRATRGPGGVL